MRAVFHGGEAVETFDRTPPTGIGEPVLQFGHGGEAVENVYRFCAAMRRKLQFGHGGEAVETHSDASADFLRRGNVSSFNSATAVKPWRPQRFEGPATASDVPASIRPRR